MSMVINTNTASLIAQAAQAKTNSAMETAMERLSTGKRINSASDDAAGMAMASRVESQIRGLTIAVRNAGDASSLIDTAEAAMAEQSNMLQRMRELAIQASNGTNSVADRLAIQDEVSQLRSELDRISTTTSWAGNKLLDGSFTTKKFQVGIGATETVSMSITAQGSSDLGVFRFDSTSAVQGVTDAATDKVVTDFDVLGKDGSAEATFAAGSSAKTVAAAVNADSSTTGVTASAVTIARISLSAVPSSTVSFNINGGGTKAAISQTVTSNTDLTTLKDAINAAAGSTGVTADFYGTDKSYLVLTDADGDDILLEDFSDTLVAGTNLSVEAGNFDGTSFGSATTVASAATATATKNDAVIVGVVRMESTKGFTLADQEKGGGVSDTDTSDGTEGYFGTASGGTASATNVSGIDVATEAGARSAISVLDGAIEAVNETRSELGATSNRLEYTINNLTSMVTNAGASKSRIEDADFAVETSNLTKAQILSQAATAMLAQANASKQSVLSLLQG
jgi:flagellin